LEAYELYISLGLAIAAGLLIGIERERSAPRDPSANSFLGGARTHPLVALVAGLSVLLSHETGWPVVVAAFAALILFLVVNFADDVRRGAERGLTSEAAFLVSFLLGALALTRDVIHPPAYKFFAVAAVAVLVTALLSAKPALNPLVRRLSREDVVATLKFLILAVVVLPLLPDRAFGPFEALNPRQIGLLVVLTAGISFLSYAAIRALGPQRGLGLTGLVGGLASSTAVTLSMSARARGEPRLVESLVLSVVLSSSIMFIRMGILIAVAGPALLRLAWLPLAVMAAAGLLVSLWFYRRSKEKAKGDLELSNPFQLWPAIKFALLFALVLLGSKAATAWFGARGAYVAAALAGIADVDAITLSMARLAQGALRPEVAVVSLFLAAATNTVVKAILATRLGGWAFGRHIASAFAIILAAGGVVVTLAAR
jgi:uncharacterized membrane protein (DUF4010 family)